MKMELLTGAYTILGRSLYDSQLLDERWNPVPRKKLNPTRYSVEDADAVQLFCAMEKVVFGYGVTKAEQWTKRPVEAIAALPENMREGNHVLTAAHMASLAVSGAVGPSAALIGLRAQRLIDAISPEVERVAGEQIRLNSFRIADNIDRYLDGRPVLDGELRDAWMKRIGVKR